MWLAKNLPEVVIQKGTLERSGMSGGARAEGEGGFWEYTEEKQVSE